MKKIFKLSVLSVILAAVSLICYIISSIMAVPGVNADMVNRIIISDLWMYIILFILPVFSVVTYKNEYMQKSGRVLFIISVIFLCFQVLAAILFCVFMFAGVPSFYMQMTCSAPGRMLVMSFIQAVTGGNLRTVIVIIGELCALGATSVCAAYFIKVKKISQ